MIPQVIVSPAAFMFVHVDQGDKPSRQSIAHVRSSLLLLPFVCYCRTHNALNSHFRMLLAWIEKIRIIQHIHDSMITNSARLTTLLAVPPICSSLQISLMLSGIITISPPHVAIHESRYKELENNSPVSPHKRKAKTGRIC